MKACNILDGSLENYSGGYNQSDAIDLLNIVNDTLATENAELTRRVEELEDGNILRDIVMDIGFNSTDPESTFATGLYLLEQGLLPLPCLTCHGKGFGLPAPGDVEVSCDVCNGSGSRDVKYPEYHDEDKTMYEKVLFERYGSDHENVTAPCATCGGSGVLADVGYGCLDCVDYDTDETTAPDDM